MGCYKAVRLMTVIAAMALFATLPPGAQAGERLKIDADHSTVGFSVRHLFTRVHGQFRSFEGTLEFDEHSIESSKVTAKIQAASVDTNVKDRDEDLRSNRFFDVEKHPTLDFTGSAVKKVDATHFTILGKLTMHGVTKDVELAAEFQGKGKDPWGNLRYGFRATTIVNRKDFGMQWNEVVETGGVLVGEEIEIVLDIEAMPAN